MVYRCIPKYEQINEKIICQAAQRAGAGSVVRSPGGLAPSEGMRLGGKQFSQWVFLGQHSYLVFGGCDALVHFLSGNEGVKFHIFLVKLKHSMETRGHAYIEDTPDPDFSFPCTHCPATFLSLRHLRKHTTNEHTIVGGMECDKRSIDSEVSILPSDFIGIRNKLTNSEPTEYPDETRAISIKCDQASKIFTTSPEETDYHNESQPITNKLRLKYPCVVRLNGT
jgi:hypothetical protein